MGLVSNDNFVSEVSPVFDLLGFASFPYRKSGSLVLRLGYIYIRIIYTAILGYSIARLARERELGCFGVSKVEAQGSKGAK